MSTRGALGFRINGIDKITYNHFDSQPEYLGATAVAFARDVAADFARYRLLVEALAPVYDKQPPSPAAFSKLRAVGLDVASGGSIPDWYEVLRHVQGCPDAILTLVVYDDAAAFLADSLFCEFAYIVNFDSSELELYRGFNRDADAEGRYAALGRPSSDYKGVALVATHPLQSIPQDWERPFRLADDNGLPEGL